MNIMNREIPIAEALKQQIEVQKRLEEQFEVFYHFSNQVNYLFNSNNFLPIGTKEIANENRGSREVFSGSVRESTNKSFTSWTKQS